MCAFYKKYSVKSTTQTNPEYDVKDVNRKNISVL